MKDSCGLSKIDQQVWLAKRPHTKWPFSKTPDTRGLHARVLRADPRSWDSGAMRWFGQASEHDADHGETDESGGGSCIALEVARQAAASIDPGEGAFDDPALGKND